MIEAAAGSLIANMITFAFVFGLWRLTKNERDWGAIFICLICCGAGAIIALAVPN